MMNADRRTYLVVAAIAALLIGLDQYTKYLVCAHLPLYGRIEVLPGWLDLVHIRNTGIAFGLLQGMGGRYKTAAMLVVAAVAAVLIGVLVAQVRRSEKLQIASLALILGGAIGNLIDRVRFGEVVDFIDAHWRNLYHWPAFNVADAAISVGITLIVLDELFLKRRKAEVGRQKTEERKA